jgi:hypothetical protein
MGTGPLSLEDTQKLEDLVGGGYLPRLHGRHSGPFHVPFC